MENGELRMENGELRMENGEWRMKNNFQFSIINSQLIEKRGLPGGDPFF